VRKPATALTNTTTVTPSVSVKHQAVKFQDMSISNL